MISLEANSNNNDVLASFKAPRLALLKDAAVPVGDLGSAPPTVNNIIISHIVAHCTII